MHNIRETRIYTWNSELMAFVAAGDFFRFRFSCVDVGLTNKRRNGAHILCALRDDGRTSDKQQGGCELMFFYRTVFVRTGGILLLAI